MFIIGSTAVKYFFPDFPPTPKDVDYIVSDKKMWTNSPGIEYLENDELWWNQEKYSVSDGKNNYLLPDILYTLKISHIFWDINWDKHTWDIVWLQKKVCKLDRDLFYKLYYYWEITHGKNKRSNLKMSAEDFFDNALKSEYSHDWLHTILQEIPTYTKVLFDDAEVEVSEEKFNSLSFVEKCNLVVEEIMVMAFERYKELGWQKAYHKMFKKFLISHAPIWEALFILENFVYLHKARVDFIKIIEEGIKNSKLGLVEK